MCYDGKSSIGSFALVKTAQIAQFKLQHVSGAIFCSQTQTISYWSCGTRDKLLTLITDNRKVVTPLPNYKSNNELGSFEIPSPYTALSEELVIPAFGYTGYAGKQLDIWFLEAFLQIHINDNYGEHCVNVYVNYL